MDCKGASGYQYEGLEAGHIVHARVKRLQELEMNLFILEMEREEYLACALIGEPEELPEIEKALHEVNRKIAFGRTRAEAVRGHQVPVVNVKETSEE
jgi:hypothetical protein